MLAATLVAIAGLVLTGLMIRRDGRRFADPRTGRAPEPRAPIGLFDALPDGRIEGCNARCRELLGMTRTDQTRGREVARYLVDEAARKRWREWLAEDGTEAQLQLRTRLRRRDGVTDDVILSAERYTDEAGAPRIAGALTVAVELTAALQRAEREAALLEEVITAAPIGMVTFDRTGKVGGVWNRASEAILGWSAEEVRGEVVPLLPEPLGPTQGPESGGGVGAREVRRWRRDGEAIDLSITTARIGADGERVAVLQDITDRLRSEGERKRLSEIVRTTPDLVLVLDVDGQILYQNPAARDRLPQPREAREPSHPLGTEWRDRWHQEIVPMVAAGSSWTGELTLGPAPGFLASIVVAGHRSHEGNLAYLSVLARDISKQRSVEEQLRHSQKLEAVGQLSGGIAHDFNNLLTVVQANSELLAEASADAEEQALLTDIQGSVRRGRDLVRRLMVFSRDESLTVRSFRVLELEDYVRTLRRLLPETVVVEWECTAADPVINADPGALQQILLNLATNARDAMPNGGALRIGVSEVADDERADDPGRLEIAVSDTGSGIPAEDLERIFEPFYTTKTPGKGTGLGLSMVYGLVAELGGEIVAESTVDVGTTFRLLLPRAAPEDAKPEKVTEASAPKGGSETILVVEDEEAIRRVARRTLERSGYTVLDAADGQEGWEVFTRQADEIDLVLSDVVMPRLGGPAMLERIRADGYDVPCMLMSGYTEREARREAKVDTSTAVLSKPWTRDDLHDAVARVLEQARTERSPEAGAGAAAAT